ncbi:MAG: FAD:protein FMN transferase [Bacteroidetes bacterium]|nr:FAD:protein FMN transferase [Bacteroidota bacterium]MCL2302577.1 FAD:protein FMN transferase [Lentimicrobiaceae bacterium]
MSKITTFLLTLSITFYACTTQPPTTHISGEALGTYYHITIADKNNITQLQIDSVIAELNNTASIFNPNSLVSRINRNETDTLNQILKDILEVSLQVCEETGGAFDFTVGALVNLWGFGKDTLKKVSPEEVAKALETVGYKKIKIDRSRIIKENPETQLNFNAVAKGYCVDLVAAFLTSKGLENFLVDIGGELSVHGKRAPNKKWRVGIQKPTETKKDAISAEEIMELQDISVATSGNYRNYIEINGKRYGHTINPHTGYPEMTDLLSVTVLAPTCALADAYATAFMVMGAQKAQTFVAQDPKIEAYFITVTNDK